MFFILTYMTLVINKKTSFNFYGGVKIEYLLYKSKYFLRDVTQKSKTTSLLCSLITLLNPLVTG